MQKTRLSSKGQIVIPLGILDVMPVKTGIQLPVVYILLSHPERSPSSQA